MANTYPKRPKFFSLRFTRVLIKSGAIQEIGQGAVALLVAVVTMEDEKRYTGAVCFWNDHLKAQAGFLSWKALDTARDRAVDAGWLHYEPGGTRRAGRYWVTIPDRLEVLMDGGIEDGSDMLAGCRDQAPADDGSVLVSPEKQRRISDRNDDNREKTPQPLPADYSTEGTQSGDKREINGRQSGDKERILLSSPCPILSYHLPERDATTDQHDLTTPQADVPRTTDPRGTKNDTVVITPGRDVAIPSADPVHGLGVWVRWRTNDRSRQDENVATIRSLVTTHGAIVVQRAAERLQRAGAPDRDRKPGDKCWPDELLPEILREQAATAATAPPATAPAEDLSPIVRQAHALVALHGDDVARSALGWTPANAPTRRSILEAANRLAVAQELVDHLAALPPPDGNPAARSA